MLLLGRGLEWYLNLFLGDGRFAADEELRGTLHVVVLLLLQLLIGLLRAIFV